MLDVDVSGRWVLGTVPEHYHVEYLAGDPMGYVVTADGKLYRIVYGDC